MRYPVKNRRSSVPFLFDDFFTKDLFKLAENGMTQRAAAPAVNIKETEKEFQLEVSAPGMDKEDFKLELVDNMLTISGERKSDKEAVNEQGEYTQREFSFSSFSRSFTLPEDKVDEEAIVAAYENGILNITIPKKEEEPVKESKRMISIG